tara:strand:+ start:124 stop:510 length:387 start_codon:yes stop_codon:yes gene_type:complete
MAQSIPIPASNFVESEDTYILDATMVRNNGDKAYMKRVKKLPREGKYDNQEFASFLHGIRNTFYYSPNGQDWFPAREYQALAMKDFEWKLTPVLNEIHTNKYTEKQNKEVSQDFDLKNDIKFTLVFKY